MEEVDADAEVVFDAVAAGVSHDEIAGGDIVVVGYEEREAFATQAGDSHLAEGALVAWQANAVVEIANVLVAAFGDVEVGGAPIAGRALFQIAQQRGAASADGDERDAALVDLGEFGIADEFGIEVEPVRIPAGQFVPELDEAQQFAGLIGAGEIGVGIAKNTAFLLADEERQHAGPGLAAQGEVVVVQAGGIAAKGDGVEVEAEGIGFGEEQRSELADPTGQEAFLLSALGAEGVIVGEGFLRQDVEAGEEAKCFVEVEIVDVAAAFLVEEFEREQAK